VEDDEVLERASVARARPFDEAARVRVHPPGAGIGRPRRTILGDERRSADHRGADTGGVTAAGSPNRKRWKRPSAGRRTRPRYAARRRGAVDGPVPQTSRRGSPQRRPQDLLPRRSAIRRNRGTRSRRRRVVKGSARPRSGSRRARDRVELHERAAYVGLLAEAATALAS
jgi:hypothetical protein